MYAGDAGNRDTSPSSSGLFEDDELEQLCYRFLYIYATGRVILLQADSSTLAPEIVEEVQTAFRQMFDATVR